MLTNNNTDDNGLPSSSPQNDPQPLSLVDQARISPLETIKNTAESLIIALCLAFVFRALAVEPFIIPTGSMADTLRGAHFRLTCPTCGYEYHFGYSGGNLANGDTALPAKSVKVNSAAGAYPGSLAVCPCCNTQYPTSNPQWVCNGDRILVLKYLYHFIEPKRWDVVVFKNPADPKNHFIKRLIAKPGETVEIIDGDIYINGQIQRKTKNAQNVLWIPAFDFNYQPNDKKPIPGAYKHWAAPFIIPDNQNAWQLDGDRRQLIFCSSAESQNESVVDFEPKRLRHILSNFNAYNGPDVDLTSLDSDLKIDFIITPGEFTPHLDTPPDAPPPYLNGLAVILSKYNRNYRADIDPDGRIAISDLYNNKLLASDSFPPLPPFKPTRVSFQILDHTITLTVGNHTIEYVPQSDSPQDWGYDPQSAHKQLPQIRFAAKGPTSLTLGDIKIFRDVYYTNTGYSQSGRGTEGKPFTLNDDEFFVLGDNSSNSHDSRFWTENPKSYSGKQYRIGVVPRDYLAGQAYFVYWPAGFRPNPNLRWACIPNIAEMRFIK